jgi:hypothetical protein
MNLVEGHKEHYIKVSCGGVEGWVRMTRVSSLSSRYNRCKVKQFGFHFDIGFCRPIPSNVILQKERPVCISIEGHGDHYVKRVMQWCRGWVRTGRFSSLSKR